MSWQKMGVAPRYDPLTPSEFFANGQSAQQPAANTVARGHMEDDPLLFSGTQNGQPSTVFPFQITVDVLKRGQDRFNIYCAPCHDATGYGNGMVVQRGFSKPPSLHDDRLRRAPVGHFFDVITNGLGTMPSYASQIPARDRWAIIAYIRALQLSQNVNVNDLSPDDKSKIGAP
ncbi:MAG: cytochrome c [Chloroflexi bacterium]|nr:cytochrome c [Chloroflexota bacterium]